eukprot:gene4047-8439_t
METQLSTNTSSTTASPRWLLKQEEFKNDKNKTHWILHEANVNEKLDASPLLKESPESSPSAANYTLSKKTSDELTGYTIDSYQSGNVAPKSDCRLMEDPTQLVSAVREFQESSNQVFSNHLPEKNMEKEEASLPKRQHIPRNAAFQEAKAAFIIFTRALLQFLHTVISQISSTAVGWLFGTGSAVATILELFADLIEVGHKIARHWLTRGLAPSMHTSHKSALLDRLHHARSYEDWQETARQLDRLVGHVRWKMAFESTLYDYMLLRDHLDAFYQARMKDDRTKMAWLIRTTLHRNLAGMGNPKLFECCYEGTKDLIEQYVDEVVYQINYLMQINIPGMSHEDKLQMFETLRSSFGRSALLLSGGGGFGIFHLGVVRVLHQQGLLPRVISGSSAGSLMASLICTRTDEELDEFFATELPQVDNWYDVKLL